MLTRAQLERLAHACGRAEGTPPDVAEYLEGRADWAWSNADRLAPDNDTTAPAENDGPLALPRARWGLDRLARALGLRVVDDVLPSPLVGAYVRAQALVLVSDRLRPEERSPVVTHECGHAALHPFAPHEEISYLALALLYPRRLLDELGPRRITALALRQAVAYRTPAWAAEARAAVLVRVASGW